MRRRARLDQSKMGRANMGRAGRRRKVGYEVGTTVQSNGGALCGSGEMDGSKWAVSKSLGPVGNRLTTLKVTRYM